MIIQKVIKGITGAIPRQEAEGILKGGIACRWWQEVHTLPAVEIPERLTERNLIWHQNFYDQPDPLRGNRPFCELTPFISTTAGTVERDPFLQRNILTPAWLEALYFATDFFDRDDGYLFYCYVFVLGKKSVGHSNFAEELRELNIYTDFSPFQPEGEVTAKISIPPPQIEKFEHWALSDIIRDLNAGREPSARAIVPNDLYLPAESYNNVREFLS